MFLFGRSFVFFFVILTTIVTCSTLIVIKKQSNITYNSFDFLSSSKISFKLHISKKKSCDKENKDHPNRKRACSEPPFSIFWSYDNVYSWSELICVSHGNREQTMTCSVNFVMHYSSSINKGCEDSKTRPTLLKGKAREYSASSCW